MAQNSWDSLQNSVDSSSAHEADRDMVITDTSSISSDPADEAELNSYDPDSLGLSAQAFAMEFDDGASHCSILCNRTCTTLHSAAIGDIRIPTVWNCSAGPRRSLENCGSPLSCLHALTYLELLQAPAMLLCAEMDGLDVDFHTAKCGLWKLAGSHRRI